MIHVQIGDRAPLIHTSDPYNCYISELLDQLQVEMSTKFIGMPVIYEILARIHSIVDGKADAHRLNTPIITEAINDTSGKTAENKEDKHLKGDEVAE